MKRKIKRKTLLIYTFLTTFVSLLSRSSDTQRAVWKIGEISPVNANGTGSLRAKFDVTSGPSTPSAVAVQFLCEGSTLSGLDFELTGSGYRVSLIKKRFITGMRLCLWFWCLFCVMHEFDNSKIELSFFTSIFIILYTYHIFLCCKLVYVIFTGEIKDDKKNKKLINQYMSKLLIISY